jgi:hypothetical protein
MTASFHSKVGIFTPLRLNDYHVRIAKLIGFGHVGRRPELKSDETCDANVIVIEITSHLCLKPLKQVVQLLAARPLSCFASPKRSSCTVAGDDGAGW